MFSRLDGNGFGDSNRSDEGSGGGKSKVESDVKEKCVYGKNKKLS